MKRAILFMAVAILAVPMIGGFPSSVAAQDDGSGRVCGTHTLQGAYGLVGTGTRASFPAGLSRS